MPRPMPIAIGGCCLLLAGVFPAAAADPSAAIDAERLAVRYLSQEVPNWPRQNNCFSCHNNGDAARALFVAAAMSHPVPSEALSATRDWLLDPLEWDDPKGDPGFSDLKLARIQFAAALTEAFQTGSIRDQAALVSGAERLIEDQEQDGSWDVDVPGVVGSPATYGDALGTYMARRTLAAADAKRFANEIARADDWILTVDSAATVDVAARALGLADRLRDGAQSPAPRDAPAEPAARFRETIDRILASQNSDGGWGPYPKSPAEPFDTAVALLALKSAADLDSFDRESLRAAAQKGRDYLVSVQLPAGGWPETTRPSGFQSYAQHISTSGWATLALLKTRDFAK